MSRCSKLRRILSPPDFTGYKPHGCSETGKEPVYLLYEEYEAIKLADYKRMNHYEASVMMGISRATFARIYETARRKIALALVETREITAINGNSYTEKMWFVCGSCHARFTIPGSVTRHNCPLCKSDTIENIISLKI